MSKQTQQQKDIEQAVENFRQTVVQEELLARLNKASYEKMKYYIDGLSIVPEYDRLTTEAERVRAQHNADRQAQGGQIISTALDTPFVPTPEPPSGSIEVGPATSTEE